jgi:hypothetical protein
MPRFYFHVCNSTGFVQDEEGQKLADVAAARKVALVSARDIMAADVRAGELDLASFIEVEDESREWLFTMMFLDAVDLKGQERPPHGGGASKHTQH